MSWMAKHKQAPFDSSLHINISAFNLIQDSFFLLLFENTAI